MTASGHQSRDKERGTENEKEDRERERREKREERGQDKWRVGPPGLHTTVRELQTCTFQGRGLQKHTQNSREREKTRNFRPPTSRCPTLRCPTLLDPQLLTSTLRHLSSGLHLKGPQPSGPHFSSSGLKQVNTFTGLIMSGVIR